MMLAARDAAASLALPPRLLAVTVLTSLDATALTEVGDDYFSAATSVDGGSEIAEDAMSSASSSRSPYPPQLGSNNTIRQLTPNSDLDGAAEYLTTVVAPSSSSSSSRRPGLSHSGSTRKPLPALPEVPD